MPINIIIFSLSAVNIPPLIYSKINKAILPPSRGGIGNKFSIPRLMLNNAINSNTGRTPSFATSPVTCATPIGPPRGIGPPLNHFKKTFLTV